MEYERIKLIVKRIYEKIEYFYIESNGYIAISSEFEDILNGHLIGPLLFERDNFYELDDGGYLVDYYSFLDNYQAEKYFIDKAKKIGETFGISYQNGRFHLFLFTKNEADQIENIEENIKLKVSDFIKFLIMALGVLSLPSPVVPWEEF